MALEAIDPFWQERLIAAQIQEQPLDSLDVLQRRGAAASERYLVVQLETMRGVAASTVVGDKGAPAPIALVDRAADVGWDVA